LAARFDLREVDAGANVLLAKNAYDVVFERTESLHGSPSSRGAGRAGEPGRAGCAQLLVTVTTPTNHGSR
jgi:hypothetical protein